MSDSKKEVKPTADAKGQYQFKIISFKLNYFSAVTDDKNKVELGLLEEDDEFEEFETEDWKQDDKDLDADNLWEDNWDDDNIEDDFTLQLRYVI